MSRPRRDKASRWDGSQSSGKVEPRGPKRRRISKRSSRGHTGNHATQCRAGTTITQTLRHSPTRDPLYDCPFTRLAPWRSTALQRIAGGIAFTELKTARAYRTLALPNVAISSLTSHRVRQLEQRLIAGSLWSDDNLVFTNRNGKPLDRANVRKQFHGLLESTNLPKIRIHDLRHTAATLLLLQGVNPRTVMELLGHSDVTMTLNTYSHVLASLKQEAAQCMDAALATNS